jgi:hypothetical protein
MADADLETHNSDVDVVCRSHPDLRLEERIEPIAFQSTIKLADPYWRHYRSTDKTFHG